MQEEPFLLFFSSNLLLMLGGREGGLPLIAAVTPHQAEGSSAGRGEGRACWAGPAQTESHIVSSQPAGVPGGPGARQLPWERGGPRAPLQENSRRPGLRAELPPALPFPFAAAAAAAGGGLVRRDRGLRVQDGGRPRG